MHTITALVFDDFETLDLFGPVEMFGSLPEHYRIQFASMAGGVIHSKHGVAMQTTATAALAHETDIVLVPGGFGTRELVYDLSFLQTLTTLTHQADWVLSVCTGSALLAKSGVLDGKQATSNKLAWPCDDYPCSLRLRHLGGISYHSSPKARAYIHSLGQQPT